MLQVYLDPCTVNSRKVLAGLDLFGTKYDLHPVDYFAGGQKDPEFVKINPHATVPAAVDGDLLLTESNAILQYAAETAGSSAYPKDLKERASVNRWLLWEASAWFPCCYVYLVEYVVKPLLKAAPSQEAIAAQEPKFRQYAHILDAQLAKTKYLVSNELTIADIAVAAPMHLHAAQRLPLESYPNLRRWIADIEVIPSWIKTQTAVNKALLPGNGSGGQVRSSFNYTKDVDRPTELYFYEDAVSSNIHEPGDDLQEMTVHDGWSRVKDFSHDEHGFSVHDFQTAYQNWEDEGAMKEQFYPEVVEFLKRTTGAKRILVFDHTIRTKTNEAKKLTDEKSTSQRSPVRLVHCDYTAESGPLRVQQLLGDEAKDLLSRRVAFFNVWKPVRHVVEELPLAMCDVTSSPQDDFFKLYLRYRDRTGENYVMRHSKDHKWWYFPKMTTDKVIILKTYESETDGRARFVGHTAFVDPTSPADARTRESVEIRTMAFF